MAFSVKISGLTLAGTNPLWELQAPWWDATTAFLREVSAWHNLRNRRQWIAILGRRMAGVLHP